MYSHVPSRAHPAVLLASNVPFAIIFGIFVVALIVLIVIVLMWAIRRDRVGRAEWRKRQQGEAATGEGDLPPAPG